MSMPLATAQTPSHPSPAASDMVEQVARAIVADMNSYDNLGGWDGLPEEGRDQARAVARSAITGMRVMPDAMRTTLFLKLGIGIATWEACIDAALAPNRGDST